MWGMVTRELPQCGRAIPNFVAFCPEYIAIISALKGPLHSCHCYIALERTKRLISRVAELLSDRYSIVHIDNCNEYSDLAVHSIDEVEAKAKKHIPDVLANSTKANYSCDKKFSESIRSDKEAQKIHAIARSINPSNKLHAIPTGLQVERGPDDAIIEYSYNKCHHRWDLDAL
ncbi:hypothetical protein N7504_003437 [Penicillium tannophilum]|nr:hypothetical protein N7504_003437 [Penicillium tannophilum]